MLFTLNRSGNKPTSVNRSVSVLRRRRRQRVCGPSRNVHETSKPNATSCEPSAPRSRPSGSGVRRSRRRCVRSRTPSRCCEQLATIRWSRRSTSSLYRLSASAPTLSAFSGEWLQNFFLYIEDSVNWVITVFNGSKKGHKLSVLN